jgi:hypothetical protein
LKNFILILLTFITLLSYGQGRDVYTTTSAGSWVNALNWDLGVAPDNDQTDGSDDIIITHHITLTDDLTVKSGTNITVTGCDTLYVTGNVTFNNGSSITVDSCAFLIIDGNVTNNNNSNDVTINGTIIIAGDYDGGNGSELGGTGSMDITGSVTTTGDGTVFGSEDDCVTDCDNSASSPLPITLVYFDVTAQETNIYLEWETASEVNNDYFEIYKSYNGIDWFCIGFMDGSGNSNVNVYYGFYDGSIIKENNYYKLKQVDFDGNSTESNIVYIKGNLNKVEVEVQFYDLMGKEVKTIKQSQIFIIIRKYKDGTIKREKIYK